MTTRFTRFMPSKPLVGRDLNLILDSLDGGPWSQNSPVVSGSSASAAGSGGGVVPPGSAAYPSVPTGFGGTSGIDNISQANNGYAYMTWNPNPAGEFVMEYDVQYRKGADTNMFMNKVGGGTYALKVNNLFPGNTYMFSLRAVNGAGYWSPWSSEVTIGIAVDNTPPDIPTGLQAFTATKGVYVTWVPVSGGNSGDLAGYDVAISSDGGVTFPTIQQLGPGVSYFYSYTSLNPATTQASLQFKVRSRDWTGNTSAFTNAVTATVGGLQFDEITVGTLLALGTISATGGLQTASSGQRLVLDSVGLRTFNASNAQTASLTAASGSLQLAGDLTVSGTITGGTIVGAILETSSTVLTTGGFLADSTGMRVVANTNTYVPTGTTTWFANANGQFLSAQILPVYGGYYPVDSSTRYRIRFEITADIVKIVKVLLSFTLQPFIEGQPSSHTHGFSGGTNTGSESSHDHAIHVQNSGSSLTTKDSLRLTDGGVNDGPTGWRTANAVTGDGTVAYFNDYALRTSATGVAGHVHDLSGVTSASTSTPPTSLVNSGMAQGVHVYVDGTDRTTALSGPWGSGSALDVSDLDISTWVTTTGWHEIQFSSTAIGGITAQMYIKCIVQSI